MLPLSCLGAFVGASALAASDTCASLTNRSLMFGLIWKFGRSAHRTASHILGAFIGPFSQISGSLSRTCRVPCGRGPMEHRDSGMLDLELCREIEERRLRRGFVERTRAAKGAAGPSQRPRERSPSSLAPMVVARIVCTKRRQTQIPLPVARVYAVTREACGGG